MNKVDKNQTQIQMNISTLEQLAEVTACLQRQLQQWNISAETQMDIRLCVMEAVQNGLLYGCPADNPDASVQISWQCTSEGFCFTVTEEGPGVPEQLRKQDGDILSLEEHGRGLLLMRTILDEVRFNQKGNSITGKLHW